MGNILRGFASAVATITTAVMSVFLFGFELKVLFAVGSLFVIGSTMLYGNVLKMPTNQEWWNSESDLCRAARKDVASPPALPPTVKLPVTPTQEKDAEMVL